MTGRFFEDHPHTGVGARLFDPAYYPDKYQCYLREETGLLQDKLRGPNTVLDAGVGTGRLIPTLAPLVNRYVGIDNADSMVEAAQVIARAFENVDIKSGDLMNLEGLFPAHPFDYCFCVLNTLGNVADEAQVLRQLAGVTKKSVYLTVCLKGTVKDRREWYDMLGITYTFNADEVAYFEEGLRSKAYSLDDIARLAEASGLRVIDHRILGEVMLWTELSSSDLI